MHIWMRATLIEVTVISHTSRSFTADSDSHRPPQEHLQPSPAARESAKYFPAPVEAGQDHDRHLN